MKKKIYAFIFARGGSKGLPGKNVLELSGKPLVAWSIDIAKNISQVDKIFVSSDDDKIIEVSKKYGAEIITRPSALADDYSPEWLSWKHAIDFLDAQDDYFDIFLSLPTTSPLRNTDDIQRGLEAFDNNTDVAISISESSRSPIFNMVKNIKESDMVELVIKDKNSYSRRQDVPKTFDVSTAFYVTSPQYIKNSDGIFQGRVRGVEIPKERAIDIDTKLDFSFAEFLIKKNKL